MKLQVLHIPRPLSVSQFSDGQAYELPRLQFQQPHIFSRIAFLDDTVIKLPTQRGYSEYRQVIRYEQKHPDDIRSNESIEKFSNIEGLLAKYPSFRSTVHTVGVEKTHCLLVHRFQYERLCGCPFEIPETRFVMMKTSLFSSFGLWTPAIVQTQINGTTLWDMFDHINDVIRPDWQSSMPYISDILNRVLNSHLRDHINWNISNIIFDKDSNKLYYIDIKPSTMYTKSINDLNIAGINRIFI